LWLHVVSHAGDALFVLCLACVSSHGIFSQVLGQPLSRQPDAIVALELADLVIHNNFFRVGEPGYSPPWPKVHNIMYC
jgi:hypothetical protein